MGGGGGGGGGQGGGLKTAEILLAESRREQKAVMKQVSFESGLNSRRVDATGRTSVFFCIYFELVAVHPAYKTFSAGLDVTEKRLMN